jgi:hypothetical protein
MMYNTNEEVTKVFREVVIREQLKKMFKNVKSIDYVNIVFCAYELAEQIEGYRNSSKFNGGKC